MQPVHAMSVMSLMSLDWDMGRADTKGVTVNDADAVDALLADLPEVLTPEEISDLLRVSTATVTRWQRDSGLKTLVLGERLRRVRKTDLRAFLITADQMEEPDA